MELLRKFNLDQKPIKVLAFLLATDLLFIILHVIHKAARFLDIGTVIRRDDFNVYYDLTLGEAFQYVKEFWIVLALAWLIFKKKEIFFSGWALLFSYLFLDDMFGIHNGLATFAIQKLNIDPFHVLYGSFRYQDIGELCVSLLFGALFLSLIAYFYLHGNAQARTMFHFLIAGLLMIFFFGVVNDTFNRVFDEHSSKMLYETSRLIEDGGEMISMSFMCWYVLTLTEPSASANL